MLKKTALALATATLLLTACSDNGTNTTANALTFYVSDGAKIYTLSGSNALLADEKTLTGLNSGSLLYAMDFNPRAAGTAVVSTGLSGLGSDGQSYSVDAATGTVTLRGTPDTTEPLNDKAVEIDYNPRAAVGAAGEGRVYRVTSSTGQNYRRQSDSGAKAGTDSSFAYVTGDTNAGKSVIVSAVAYTNSGVAATVPATTVAYVLDSQNDVLSVLGGTSVNTANTDGRNAAAGACPATPANPDCGQLRTVGRLGTDISGFVGFDILNASEAYATAFADGTYNLYSVNLLNGQMTFITGINPKIVPVRSFAVQQTAR
ncbi:MAG: DUF4394 domain-containing protein [Pseudomonadota bacterium]